jgi:MFS family permease
LNRWGILAVLFTVRAVMGFQFQSIASTSVFLVDDLGIEFIEIGTLVGLYLLPGVVFAYPSGALGKRFGDARIVIIGLILMAVGGYIVGFSQDYSTAMVGRVLCGTGAILLNVLVTKMLIDWFSGREVIAAMAILVNSWPFDIALGLITQGWIAENYSWAIVQYLAAGMSVVGLLLMITLYRKPPTKAANPTAGAKPRGLSAWEVSLASVAGLI